MPVFVIRNQQGQFLNKQKEWQDSGDNRSLMRLKYHDEALNVVFELSSKDIYLRAIAVECEQDSSGHPVIIADDMPMPFSGAPDDSNNDEPEVDNEVASATDNAEQQDLVLEAEPTNASDEPAEEIAEQSIEQSDEGVTDENAGTVNSAAPANESELDEEAELAAALAEEHAERALIEEAASRTA